MAYTLQTQVNLFLVSLAAWLASRAALTLGSSLWVHQAVEAVASDPYAVLRVYPGDPPDTMRNIPQLAIQVYVTSTDEGQGLDLAIALFKALRADAPPDGAGGGRFVAHQVIPGKQINPDGTVGNDATGTDGAQVNWTVESLIANQTPGQVGRDDKGLWNVAFNFDASFHR